MFPKTPSRCISAYRSPLWWNAAPKALTIDLGFIELNPPFELIVAPTKSFTTFAIVNPALTVVAPILSKRAGAARALNIIPICSRFIFLAALATSGAAKNVRFLPLSR